MCHFCDSSPAILFLSKDGTDKEVSIMQTTMNYRGVTRYSYDTTRPTALATLLRRVIGFFRATLATRKTNAHGLSNAMEARLYL